jgi:hypothetical protein
MKRFVVLVALLGVVLPVAGCQSGNWFGGSDDKKDSGQSIVGTWRGRDDAANTPFQFAAVTFAPDGTYTAQMRYADQLRADSGRYTFNGGTLKINEGNREYSVLRQGDTLQVTDVQTKHAVTLDRLK